MLFAKYMYVASSDATCRFNAAAIGWIRVGTPGGRRTGRLLVKVGYLAKLQKEGGTIIEFEVDDDYM